MATMSSRMLLWLRGATSAAWGTGDDVYRVKISQDGSVKTYPVGGNVHMATLGAEYPSVEAMPLWAQRKIAVLSLIEVSGEQQEIDGVGYRMARDVYWIIRNGKEEQ